MNRRKKGIQILKARNKRAKAKLAPIKKSIYISKSERTKLTEVSELSPENVSEE